MELEPSAVLTKVLLVRSGGVWHQSQEEGASEETLWVGILIQTRWDVVRWEGTVKFLCWDGLIQTRVLTNQRLRSMLTQ
jgi:hypothetical protein